MFAFFRNPLEKQMSLLMQRFLRWIFVRNQLEDSKICASKQLIRFSSDLGTVAVVIEGSDLSITEDNVVPLQDVFRTRRKGNWWPDQIFRDYDVVCAISIMSKQWGHLIVFHIFSQKYWRRYNTTGLMLLLEMPLRQHTGTTRGSRAMLCATPLLPSC